MRHNPDFYRTPEWRAARSVVLAAHPVCETVGCVRPAKQVDHRRAMRDGGAALDPANLTAVCWPCHSRKTACRDGGFGNAKGGKVRPLRGADANGNPLAGWGAR